MDQSRHIRCGRAVDARDSFRPNAPEQVQHPFMKQIHSLIIEEVLGQKTASERTAAAQRMANFAFAALISEDGPEGRKRLADILADIAAVKA